MGLLFALEFLHQFGEKFRVRLGEDVVDPVLGHLQYLHRLGRGQPKLFLPLPVGQVEVADQFPEPLKLNLVRVFVVPLDDALLVAGVIWALLIVPVKTFPGA